MGCRGAYGFKLDGEYLLTYNHKSSNPDGLGSEIVAWIREDKDWELMKERIRNLTKVNDKEDEASEEEQERYMEYYVESKSRQAPSDWYCLLRKLQFAGILEEIYTGEVEHFIDNTSFIYKSFFCEWGYIINLDEETFEIFEGFQEKPDPENPLGQEAYRAEMGGKFYPCKPVERFPLSNIPRNWLDYIGVD